MSARHRWLIVAALAAVTAAAPAPAAAQDWQNDVRIRLGWWIPEDLPTDPGFIPAIEVRNLVTDRDGIAYGIGYYHEKRTEDENLRFGSTPERFRFEADVEIIPVTISWFHIWPRAYVTWYAGAGGGIYVVDALSQGYSLDSNFKIFDYGDFRELEDGTYIGAHAFGGIDFFPDSRWGAMAELRFHLIEEDYSAAEISAGALFRF